MTLYISTSTDKQQLAERSAEVLEVLGGKAIEKYGKFVLSLAGGSTPRELYAKWASSSRLDWDRVVLLFGDERCVSPEDEASNYRMVAESLLPGLPGQPEVIRMEGEHADPAQAAHNYDYALRRMMDEGARIHVALLGIGTDGHTASLFPGTEALREAAALCTDTPSPGGGPHRITMTVPCLKGARKLMFLAAGSDKAPVLHSVLEGGLDPEQLPAQFFLRDDRLNVNLLLDEAAAANLNRRG